MSILGRPASLSAGCAATSKSDPGAPPVSGSAWLLGYALLQAGFAIAIRQLVTEHHASIPWVLAIRFFLTLGLLTLPAMAGYWCLKVHNRAAFFFRGLWGAATMLVFFHVVQQAGLGRGTVLFNLTGLFGTLAAVIMLREKPTFVTGGGLLVAIGGVALMSEQGLPQGPEWLGLLSALLGGLTLVAIRVLRRTDSTLISLLSQSVCGLALLVPALPGQDFPLGISVWSMIGMLIFCDIAAQLCLSQGLGMVPVARASSILMLSPLVSLLAGTMFFAEQLTGRQLLGCALVLGAGLVAVAWTPKPMVPSDSSHGT